MGPSSTTGNPKQAAATTTTATTTTVVTAPAIPTADEPLSLLLEEILTVDPTAPVTLSVAMEIDVVVGGVTEDASAVLAAATLAAYVVADRLDAALAAVLAWSVSRTFATKLTVVLLLAAVEITEAPNRQFVVSA